MRTILHSDLNNCYASIECLHRPELRGLPVAVTGDPEARHGIILAKNMEAKAFGVVTGEPINFARAKCPNLVTVKANFPLYSRFCRQVRRIYADYTDLVEPFGLDEAWLDVTDSRELFGDGAAIAEDIRRRVKEETGLTVSIGVSFNKIFAKLGSDIKKPDAVTVITPRDYKNIVWPLDVNSLLFVGSATRRKLNKYGLFTIGDVAQASPVFLRKMLGKNGETLYNYANGLDRSPVVPMEEAGDAKSVGNSVTTPRDLETLDDVKVVFYILCDCVAQRLRQMGLKCSVVTIGVKDKALGYFERQMHLPRPSNITDDLIAAALKLFVDNWNGNTKLRSLSVRGTQLISSEQVCPQVSLFEDESSRIKKEQLAGTVDSLRGRFGRDIVRRAVTILDSSLSSLDPKGGSIIFPASFIREEMHNNG